jgi:hypothetical protein
MKAETPELKADPSYAAAFAQIMSRIDRALGASRPRHPVIACVAGGAALHFYTGGRVSKDIDATLTARVLLDAADLRVSYTDRDGGARMLYYDTQYNDTLALVHEDAQEDALPIRAEGVDPRRLEVRLLTPLDLAFSKLSRFSDQDREDIRALAREGLVTAKALKQRAEDALAGYVGSIDRVRTSIDLACGDITSAAASVPRRGRSRSPRKR